jgi:hypothetical protein
MPGFVSVDAPLVESPGFGHSGEQAVRYPTLAELAVGGGAIGR